jgi:hypothetical protein
LQLFILINSTNHLWIFIIIWEISLVEILLIWLRLDSVTLHIHTCRHSSIWWELIRWTLNIRATSCTWIVLSCLLMDSTYWILEYSCLSLRTSTSSCSWVSTTLVTEVIIILVIKVAITSNQLIFITLHGCSHITLSTIVLLLTCTWSCISISTFIQFFT